MRTIVVVLCFFGLSYGYSQNGIGAWEYTSTTKDGTPLVHRMTITYGYWVITQFEEKMGQFIHTKGGSLTFKDNRWLLHVTFDTKNRDQVGVTLPVDITLTDDKLYIAHMATSKYWQTRCLGRCLAHVRQNPKWSITRKRYYQSKKDDENTLWHPISMDSV